MTYTRYTAGTRHPFIVLDVKKGERFMGPAYVPWMDELRSITVHHLLCESHHRVPCHWRGEKDPQRYDGFIFRQDDGTEWHNQFPDYSNQQLSDAMDWICHRSITEEENAADPQRWPIVHAHDAIKYLERVQRGIVDLRKAGETVNADLLERHLSEVKFMIELHTGYSVITVPYVIEKLDGTRFWMDDWPCVRLVVPVET